MNIYEKIFKKKAWQRRWLVSKLVENPCALELQIYGCPKGSKGGQPLWTEFISPDSSRLYRSRSRTHTWAFSIMKEAAVVLHLAAESEQLSQGWMSSLRDTLWPPSPIVQVEAAFQDVHRVSLIDDEQTCCCDDLFAAYGHMYVVGEVVLLMSTHSGRLIKEWRLEEISSSQVEHLDEGKTSGVFSLTLQSTSPQPDKKLQFYSQTATIVAEKISTALKSRQKDKNSSSQKYESGIQELSEFFIFPSDRTSEDCSPLSQNTSKGLKLLSTLSGDLLNCSINSVFLSSAASSSASRSSSHSSSNYSPPASPSDTMFPAHDKPTKGFESTPSQVKKRKDLFDNYYCSGVDLGTYRKSLETDEMYDDLTPLPRYSTTSGIYEDISSLPDSKRASIAETLYEDIEENEARFIELMKEIIKDEHTPPLPPPRNSQNSDVTGNKVKRPSTLGLESLSSSISETLSQLKAESTPAPSCKRNFPTGLFKPIKNVKKILGNRKSVKSSPTSPSEEKAKTKVLQSHNCECDTKENAVTEGEESLIMDFTDPSEASHEKSLNDGSNCLESQASSTLSSDENFVPFPELLSSGCDREPCIDHNPEGRESFQSSDTSSVAFRSDRGCRQTRSCNSLIVESLKSKYSRHREFLEFLQMGKNRNGSSCDIAYRKNCISRSVSLEPFPCTPPNYCNSSCDSRPSSFYATMNSRHDDHHSDRHSKSTVSEGTTLHNPLQHRNSSDYCEMNPVAPSNVQKECEANLIVHNKVGESKMKRKSSNQEWSSSIQMQITERESLYMDMTRATK